MEQTFFCCLWVWDTPSLSSRHLTKTQTLSRLRRRLGHPPTKNVPLPTSPARKTHTRNIPILYLRELRLLSDRACKDGVLVRGRVHVVELSWRLLCLKVKQHTTSQQCGRGIGNFKLVTSSRGPQQLTEGA